MLPATIDDMFRLVTPRQSDTISVTMSAVRSQLADQYYKGMTHALDNIGCKRRVRGVTDIMKSHFFEIAHGSKIIRHAHICPVYNITNSNWILHELSKQK